MICRIPALSLLMNAAYSSVALIGASADPGANPTEATAPRVASPFGDHMVLQCSLPVPLWGWAAPGTQIDVHFAGQTKSAIAGEDRRWTITLAPLAVSAQPRTLTVSSRLSDWRAAFEDVLVGEVWLCSGQSNMTVPVSQSDLAGEPTTCLDLPTVRALDVPTRASLEPQQSMDGVWRVCTPETAPGFSALALSFARTVAGDLGVPVGIIHASHGGTVAEAFMSPRGLSDNPTLHPILATWERFVDEYPATEEERQRVGDERRQEILARGEVPPPWPLDPKAPDHFHRPSLVYHGMIHPLVPYAMRGVVWYQGEANGWRAHQYRELFPCLIADWRRLWQRPDLPFLFVQVASFEADWLEDEVWAELREAQTHTWHTVPHTAMVTAIDQGDPLDIHPREKRVVGERLAAAARAVVYDLGGEFAGPRFERFETGPDGVRVHFSSAAGGLVCRGDSVRGFAVAGPDRRFHAGTARIDGSCVVLRSPAVPEPVAVRYGWSNAPRLNLYDVNGLPALPFRTDDWPGRTDGRVEPEAY